MNIDKMEKDQIRDFISYLIKAAGYMIPDEAKKEITNYSLKIEGDKPVEEVEKEIGEILENYIGSILGYNIPKNQMKKYIKIIETEEKFPKAKKMELPPVSEEENKTRYISGNDQPPEAIDYEEIKPDSEKGNSKKDNDINRVLKWANTKNIIVDMEEYNKDVIPRLSELNQKFVREEKRVVIQIIPENDEYTRYKIKYDEKIEKEVHELLDNYKKSEKEKIDLKKN